MSDSLETGRQRSSYKRMPLSRKIIIEVCSLLRSLYAQLGGLADSSFGDPLLLIPDVAPKGLLCFYLYTSTLERAERQAGPEAEVKEHEGLFNCAGNQQKHPVDKGSKVNVQDPEPAQRVFQ